MIGMKFVKGPVHFLFPKQTKKGSFCILHSGLACKELYKFVGGYVDNVIPDGFESVTESNFGEEN